MWLKYPLIYEHIYIQRYSILFYFENFEFLKLNSFLIFEGSYIRILITILVVFLTLLLLL
jgi:hypothetical protein